MADIDDMLRALKGLAAPKDLEIAIAKKAAITLQEAVTKTLEAGETPEGVAWAPKKDGHGRPYAHAASRIKTTAYGNLVAMVLAGPEVYGNFGARGAPVRRMIPDAGAALPKSVDQALTKAAGQVFDELTK